MGIDTSAQTAHDTDVADCLASLGGLNLHTTRTSAPASAKRRSATCNRDVDELTDDTITFTSNTTPSTTIVYSHSAFRKYAVVLQFLTQAVGRERVKQGRFSLRDERDGAILVDDNWEARLRGGMVILVEIW